MNWEEKKNSRNQGSDPAKTPKHFIQYSVYMSLTILKE